MKKDFISVVSIPEFGLWNGKGGGHLGSFSLELTARCNNNCRHCFSNLPEGDERARKDELSLKEIKKIIDEAASLGALWCELTGGEPLLRDDFLDIYLYLIRKGILVSILTNATLVTKAHVAVFKQYPPRDIEVTVYGVTQDVYERVTQVSGSFNAFMHGLNLLLRHRIKVRLKTVAMRSNMRELPEIASYCRKVTKDYFRYDPLLYLRFDGNQKRNEEIKSERLSAREIVAIEQADDGRMSMLIQHSDKFINKNTTNNNPGNYLFKCGAGNGFLHVSYDGYFQLCPLLADPGCRYDLKKGSLQEAYEKFVLEIRDKRSCCGEYIEKCNTCPIINLCSWCPAHSALETGKLDSPIKYFCTVAHAREKAILGDKKYAS